MCSYSQLDCHLSPTPLTAPRFPQTILPSAPSSAFSPLPLLWFYFILSSSLFWFKILTYVLCMSVYVCAGMKYLQRPEGVGSLVSLRSKCAGHWLWSSAGTGFSCNWGAMPPASRVSSLLSSHTYTCTHRFCIWEKASYTFPKCGLGHNDFQFHPFFLQQFSFFARRWLSRWRCQQAWGPEFNPYNLPGGRKDRICPLNSTDTL